MQAVRPAAEGEEALAQEQEQAAEVKREVAKAHEEEAAPEEKDVAVVGEEAEAETEGEGEAEAGASAKKNRIQVSTNKKPLYFYVNLAKVCAPLPLLFTVREYAWSSIMQYIL
jgi:cobalamin biosynthesis protein CobT